VFAGFLYEKNLAFIGVERIRHQDQRRFFLVHTGEVEKVAILFEW
jgi:hypothetical protein